MHRLGFASLLAALLFGTGGVALDTRAGDSCPSPQTPASADGTSAFDQCREGEATVRRISIRVGSVADTQKLREGYASLNTRGYNYVAAEGFRPPVANTTSEPPSAASKPPARASSSD